MPCSTRGPMPPPQWSPNTARAPFRHSTTNGEPNGSLPTHMPTINVTRGSLIAMPGTSHDFTFCLPDWHFVSLMTACCPFQYACRPVLLSFWLFLVRGTFSTVGIFSCPSPFVCTAIERSRPMFCNSSHVQDILTFIPPLPLLPKLPFTQSHLFSSSHNDIFLHDIFSNLVFVCFALFLFSFFLVPLLLVSLPFLPCFLSSNFSM
ncbi:MAG: hypothetical protein J3R72DRAFT_140294 [Linnemannia gamsii]|nr:MAG: hypothetical protein J3R72DRAFT_140294 [Linnemannia gamsii]